MRCHSVSGRGRVVFEGFDQVGRFAVFLGQTGERVRISRVGGPLIPERRSRGIMSILILLMGLGLHPAMGG
jgi:hypothetical protein